LAAGSDPPLAFLKLRASARDFTLVKFPVSLQAQYRFLQATSGFIMVSDDNLALVLRKLKEVDFDFGKV
jgi:hypothetical protein